MHCAYWISPNLMQRGVLAGMFGLFCELAGLADPGVSFGAVFEAEQSAKGLGILLGPGCDLLKGLDAEAAELAVQDGLDAFDAGEIIFMAERGSGLEAALKGRLLLLEVAEAGLRFSHLLLHTL